MVKVLASLSLLFVPVSASAQSLDNSQVYTVPQTEKWVVTDILRSPCDVCTSDIYIQSGSVHINGVWVSGTFEFSVPEKADILFDSTTVFALGDVIQRINVEKEK